MPIAATAELQNVLARHGRNDVVVAFHPRVVLLTNPGDVVTAAAGAASVRQNRLQFVVTAVVRSEICKVFKKNTLDKYNILFDVNIYLSI